MLQRSSSQGIDDYVAKINWYIHLKTIEDFIPVDLLEQKVKKIRVEKLTEEEKRAVDAFHRALKRRQDGKSDDDWRHDDED